MSSGVDILSVAGKEVRYEVPSSKRPHNDLKDVVKELNEIINKKNRIIEQQTDYIADLQEENINLRMRIKMLTI